MILFQTMMTPLFAILFGVLVAVILAACGKHKNVKGGLDKSRLSSLILLSAALYLITGCLLGNAVLNIPISITIERFGNNQAGWIFLGLAVDLSVRLYLLFDSE